VNPLDVISAQLEALTSQATIREAGLGVLAMQKRRIFEQGLNSSGGQIGKYSTKPTYFNPKDSPVKFTPKGKTGKTEFKDGKPHVTRYFGGGYKEVRQTAGRRTDKVNFDFTGQLRFSHTIGFNDNRVVLGFDSQREGRKAQSLEKKFGPVFALSEEEREAFGRFLINKAFNVST